ncbi:MAG: antibiotic biosynthesis monooxygenase [Myxococcales bacterium]|jgi:quinol monooxygenase YgiN|nr:antibiotic biosynthesis monooxygenase [Myxococcales bacterium]
MSDTSIDLVVRFSIKPGKLEAFRAKVQEIAAAVEAEEPQTVAYTTYVDAEGKAAILIERYRSSEDFLAHFKRTGPALGPLLELAPATEILTLGAPNDAAKGLLASISATFLTKVSGFSRG